MYEIEIKKDGEVIYGLREHSRSQKHLEAIKIIVDVFVDAMSELIDKKYNL